MENYKQKTEWFTLSEAKNLFREKHQVWVSLANDVEDDSLKSELIKKINTFSREMLDAPTFVETDLAITEFRSELAQINAGTIIGQILGDVQQLYFKNLKRNN